MSTLEIIGAPWGNFVRTVRMVCHEKGVPYTLTVVRPDSSWFAATSTPRSIPFGSGAGLPVASTLRNLSSGS